MHSGLADFWSQIASSQDGPSGVEVAVGTSQSDKLFGVRDGFVRYFGQGMGRPVPVAVHSEPDAEDGTHIPLSDEECLSLANDRTRRLQSRARSSYQFWVCSEMGIHSLELDGDPLHFVRGWTVVYGPTGRAVGGSGSIQLPTGLIEGVDHDQIPFAIPGTRRRGGMTSSLTSGLETRRHAVALATVQALSTLFYGVVEGRRRPLRI
jgi:non-canonical (house-cleaning) NTP pyrophosphatase